jgi:hypothetical protein
MARTILRRLRFLPFAALASGVLGCGPVAALFSDARITAITPGQSINGGDLDCWLTLEFDEVPNGIDPQDVRVRFESIALVEPSEFDWTYIAENDVVSAGDHFGAGYNDNTATTPGSPPPAGMPIKARFKLHPKEKLENKPDTLYLHATLYWGGKREDTTKQAIEHVYASTPGGFL